MTIFSDAWWSWAFEGSVLLVFNPSLHLWLYTTVSFSLTVRSPVSSNVIGLSVFHGERWQFLRSSTFWDFKSSVLFVCHPRPSLSPRFRLIIIFCFVQIFGELVPSTATRFSVVFPQTILWWQTLLINDAFELFKAESFWVWIRVCTLSFKQIRRFRQRSKTCSCTTTRFLCRQIFLWWQSLLILICDSFELFKAECYQFDTGMIAEFCANVSDPPMLL